MQGEIIRSWEYKMTNPPNQAWYLSAYQPRFNAYSLAPEENQTSHKYMGLDFFGTWTGAAPIPDFLTLHYQRPAKTYMLVAAYEKKCGIPELAGWKSEGWARRPSDKPRATLEFGFGEKNGSFGMASVGYMFSKTGARVDVPSKTFIKANVKHLQTEGYYNIFVAEEDGSITRAPAPPAGMMITPGGLCPKELHDMWTVKGHDSEDAATREMAFRTWHPLWDPCWWCSFGHEHGSSAPLLMSYWPRYDYTVLKHKGDTEMESHAGFKDFVLDTATHRVYYGIHIHVSSNTRYATRHHTLVAVVQNKTSGELEYDTQVKADFGALVARKREGGLVGVTPEMETLRLQLGYPRRHRLVNVLDPENPAAGDFSQRGPPDTRVGRYEQWATVPLCSETKNAREPAVDVKDPSTALRTPSLTLDGNVIKLGHMNSDGSLRQGLNINREFRTEGWILTDDACVFKIRNILAAPRADGKFYTDPYGLNLFDSAGDDRLVQYIKPGFRLQITGNFMTNDTWLGLYRDGDHGAMKNVMNGVVPGVN